MSDGRVETVEEFWKKWMPCDHPPITPTAAEKAEFMLDLERVIANRVVRLAGKGE